MTIIAFLYNLIIRPLQLIFELIYGIAHRVTGNPGLSIIALSLVMNILVLPLYMRADKMQEEERDKEAQMHGDLRHLKTAFGGDEKMLMLQSYYRHVGYHQLDAFKGSLSLLLEIPFFIAAYHFLSNLTLLQGVSFGPIADLSRPDALLMLGGITVNILPFIMTGVNLISSYIFSKGYPIKTRVQLYAMALFFLVFLYNSPSGLVFYWTLNNVFSLVKTVFYKIKEPVRILSYISSAAGLILLIFGVFFYDRSHFRRRVLVIGMGILLLAAGLFFILSLSGRFCSKRKKEKNTGDLKGIIPEGLFLSILLGLLIPSAVIASSVMEFIGLSDTFNPVYYLFFSVTIAVGMFILWMNVFYGIANESLKPKFELALCVFCGIATVDYMFFGTDLGVLSNMLQYEVMPKFTVKEIIINLLVVIITAAVFILLRSKFPGFMRNAMITGILVLSTMSVINIVKINSVYASSEGQLAAYKGTGEIEFQLSKKGRNVVIIMMDRALGSFAPYIFNEKPELKEKFSGFTSFANVVSYGPCTNFGVPPIYGGYEYTPTEMNKRDKEKLVDKHNEALRVMPVLFDENGYDVTVCEPPYAGYAWLPDLSIYNDHPDIKTFITDDRFMDQETVKMYVGANERNFFCYSFMKTVPVILQETVYNGGYYNECNGYYHGLSQDIKGTSVASGLKSSFMNQYNMLASLSDLTKTTDDGNNFIIMSNTVTHEPALLKEPEYVPAMEVDNTEYDKSHMDRFSLDGVSLSMTESYQFAHYETNMAALIKLGEWFDHMKETDTYDNTRIIIVADHGWNLDQERMLFREGDYSYSIDHFYPLLLVKDFDSKEFTVSEEFMTDADVPTIAVQGIIDKPVNPFTGKEINDSEKHAHDQYITDSGIFSPDVNNGYQYLPSNWLSVHDDMRDMDNWKLIAKNEVYTGE